LLTEAVNHLLGTCSAEDALKVISASLQDMINAGQNSLAKYAFAVYDNTNLPASLINNPLQKLEWAILVNLIPLFASNEFATIHRELVFGLLETVQSALLGSDDTLTLAQGSRTRAKQFRLTILNILQGSLFCQDAIGRLLTVRMHGLTDTCPMHL
jgi:hypothetical protein